jgi:hypothetical protein
MRRLEQTGSVYHPKLNSGENRTNVPLTHPPPLQRQLTIPARHYCPREHEKKQVEQFIQIGHARSRAEHFAETLKLGDRDSFVTGWEDPG